MSRKKRRNPGISLVTYKQPERLIQRIAHGEFNIAREVDYIRKRAMNGDGRLVSIMGLVLFSVAQGDAWILDPDGNLALCIVKSFEPQDINVTENERQFFIEWEAEYQIENAGFVVLYDEDRIDIYPRYPVDQIREALQTATELLTHEGLKRLSEDLRLSL